MDISKWKKCTLSDVCLQIVDGTHKTPTYTKEGVRFISIANIRPFMPITYENHERFISEEEHRELCKRVTPKRDDVLFSRIGTLGYAKKIDFDYPVSIFVGLGLARPDKSKIIPAFLEYFMNSRVVYRYSVDNAKGTGRLTLPLEASRKMPFRYPSLPEQERIVSRIEELFSQLDAGVETLKKTKAQLAVYRQAVLKEAFEGSLIQSVPLQYQKLREYIETPRYGTSKKCFYADDGTPVYRIPNIDYKTGHIDHSDIKYASFSETELSGITLNREDILIIRSNGSASLVGRAAMVTEADTSGTFAGYLMRLRIKNLNELSPKFLLQFLESHSARLYIESKAKSTSGVHNINSQEISDLPIPIFSYSDQIRILEEIESRLSVCDSIEQTVDAALQQSDALRQSILKQAFEGGL